jgi:DNA processing protein
MGTGLDAVYPRENGSLARAILEGGGCLITQFPLGTPPIPENFPYRNRVISGLSLGVVIVEASQRSGSLVTATLAAEQGRDVMAVPGNITSSVSFGTNYLIKSGAKLVQHWQDVVEELPSEIASRILPPPIARAAASAAAANSAAGETRAVSEDDAREPAGLSETESRVWKLLRADEPTHLDTLIEATGLSFGDLNSALVSLDIRDLIRVLPGKNYARRI